MRDIMGILVLLHFPPDCERGDLQPICRCPPRIDQETEHCD